MTPEPAVRTTERRLEEGSSLTICCTTAKVTLYVGCVSEWESVFVCMGNVCMSVSLFMRMSVCVNAYKAEFMSAHTHHLRVCKYACTDQCVCMCVSMCLHMLKAVIVLARAHRSLLFEGVFDHVNV